MARDSRARDSVRSESGDPCTSMLAPPIRSSSKPSFESRAARGDVERPLRLPGDLGADAVARQEQDAFHQMPLGSFDPWRRLCQASLLSACR